MAFRRKNKDRRAPSCLVVENSLHLDCDSTLENFQKKLAGGGWKCGEGLIDSLSDREESGLGLTTAFWRCSWNGSGKQSRTGQDNEGVK